MLALTLSQLLDNGTKYPKGQIGIEIEVEFPQPQEWDLNTKVWGFNTEHSIRNNGYEIISKKPLELEALEHLVASVCENINGRSPIADCPRTSVHIHVNQANNQVLHVLNSMVVYWLLETPLTRYCGEEREGHHFCLRLKDAEALIPVLCDSISSSNPLRFTDRVRYAGLNLDALNKFGSLEFRTMRGTTDAQLIISWAKAMHHLCDVAKTFESPAHVFDYFLDHSKEEFIRKFLTPELAGVVLSIPGHSGMMDESASIVCALAYHEDWMEWSERQKDKKVEEIIKKPKGVFDPDMFLHPAPSYYDDISTVGYNGAHPNLSV